MCGIIGYTGKEKAVPVVLKGLSKLEYRGYDSAGIGYFDGEMLCSVKEQGRLYNLENRLKDKDISATCAIGHTRWATHGEPSDTNAHPHGTENVLIVHNGIIENSDRIKKLLTDNGYGFSSATDTEVAAKLIDFCFISSKDPLRAIWQSLDLIEGAYAIAAVFKGFGGSVYAFRKDNPLVAATCDMGSFVTSDIASVAEYTGEYFSIDEGEIAIIAPHKVSFVTSDDRVIAKTPCKVEQTHTHDLDDSFEHFMLKEIFEEPTAVENTASKAIKGGSISFDELSDERLAAFEGIHIVACGTAYHAGLVGKRLIETLARVPVRVSYASEFRYNEPILSSKDLVVAVSQSGETADTLGAMRYAKLKGVYTFAVVNSPDSALAREADSVFVTEAGREVSVASTKAYHVQLTAFYLMALKLASIKGTLPLDEISRLTHTLLNEVPGKIREAIDNRERCEAVAKKYMDSENMFFIGRGVDVAQSKEAALKMKEISYIHCHAFAAGELKHGTISLVEDGTPVVAIITNKATLGKMVSNIQEVNARGARVIALVSEATAIPSGIAKDIIYLPDTEEIFMPLVCATATQLMAYYVSLNLGNDVDRPRNLAKSVTVE